MYNCIDTKIEDILPIPELKGKSILLLDVEVEADGCRFPDPSDVSNGKIVCVTVRVTGVDDTICYGVGTPSPELLNTLNSCGDTYVKCKDENDMLARAIRYIECLKPTYVIKDSVQDLDFLHARAQARNVRVSVPDLDRMFREYDKPLSELYGIPSDKKSCPIAEACRRLYEKDKEKK
jgi:DNA polymerase elongation subunit (family B)